MSNKHLLFSLIISLFLFSCSQESPEIIIAPPVQEEPTKPVEEPITAATVNLEARFNATFENTFYPSWWYAISNYSASSGIQEDPSFIVSYNEPKVNTSIKIEFEETLINQKTIIEQVSNSKGNLVVLAPKINWDYQGLKEISSPGTLSVPVNLYVDNALISTKYISINYRSVNECLFIYKNEGEVVEAYDMFASYVNEDHSKIDGVLREILDQGITESFVGYQRGNDGVINQLVGIWYWMQSKGIKYSSITDTSFTSPSGNLASQYIRFFDEVLNNTQANCVDGTVFIASILKKIGISPQLVLVPGHMYLSLNSAEEGRIYLIETTMVGEVDLRLITNANHIYDYYSKDYLSELEYEQYLLGQASFAQTKYRISRNSLSKAINTASNNYSNNSDKFFEQDFYHIIDVDDSRQKINPIK